MSNVAHFGAMATHTRAQEKLLSLINNKDLAQLIGGTLAEIAVELLDAKEEAAHWKRAFETVRDEIRVLAAVAMQKSRTSRLVITQRELSRVPANTQLYVGRPEPGVRVYELREKLPQAKDPASGTIALN